MSAIAVQHNGKFGNSGIGSTAGHGRVSDGGEATASADNSASNPRVVTATTKGDTAVSGIQVQQPQERSNAANKSRRSDCVRNRGIRTAVVRQRLLRFRRSDSTTYRTPFLGVMAGACIHGVCMKRNSFVGDSVHIPIVPAKSSTSGRAVLA